MSNKACGNDDCAVSTGICESMTFGRGELDSNGYWEIPCGPCARRHEVLYPEHGLTWPRGGEWEMEQEIDRLIGRLNNAKFISAHKVAIPLPLDKDIKEDLEILSRVCGNCGWTDGDLDTIIGLAAHDVISRIMVARLKESQKQ